MARIRKEIETARESGDSQRVIDLLNRYQKEYRVSGMFNKIERARRKLNQRIRQIRDTDQIPDDVKAELIKNLKDKINELVGVANQNYSR